MNVRNCKKCNRIFNIILQAPDLVLAIVRKDLGKKRISGSKGHTFRSIEQFRSRW